MEAEEEEKIVFKKDVYFIVPCPICKTNNWRDYGDTQYLCNKCDFKLDIKRKGDYVRRD